MLYHKKKPSTIHQKTLSLSSMLSQCRMRPKIAERTLLNETQQTPIAMKRGPIASKITSIEFQKAKVYTASINLSITGGLKRLNEKPQKALFQTRGPPVTPAIAKQAPLESMINNNQRKIKDLKDPRQPKIQTVSNPIIKVSRHSISREPNPEKTPRTPAGLIVKPNAAAQNLANLLKIDQQVKLLSNKTSFIEEYQTPLTTRPSAKNIRSSVANQNQAYSPYNVVGRHVSLNTSFVLVDSDDSEQPLQEPQLNDTARIKPPLLVLQTNRVPQITPRKFVTRSIIQTEVSSERRKSGFLTSTAIKKWHKISVENVDDSDQLTPKSSAPQLSRSSSIIKRSGANTSHQMFKSENKKNFIFEREMEENGKMCDLEERKTKLILPKEITKLEDKCIHGWIEKTTSKSMFFNWRRVFVTVEQQKFRYFRDQDQQAQKGVIDLRRIRAQLKLVKDEFVFQILVEMVNKEQKLFQFKTQSKNHLHAWISVIDANMGFEPFQSVQFQAAPVNFWKLNRISVEEFLRVAETGDIMLFQGTHMNCRLLQTVSGSKYDHVAALIKYPNSGQVVIFESLQGRGVCKWDWQTLINNNYWQQNYSRIVYRRLLGVERDANFNQIVKDFMAENVGRNYRLNASILLGQENQQDGFFCSELVAQLLKNLKLLPADAVPSSYWPGHFSKDNLKSQIKLVGEAFYSEELILDFQI